MAKFRFAQNKQITTWVRDIYEIEAESLDEAIAIVEEANVSLEELDYEDERVEWIERDDTFDYDNWDNRFPDVYKVISCDTDEEIVEGC